MRRFRRTKGQAVPPVAPVAKLVPDAPVAALVAASPPPTVVIELTAEPDDGSFTFGHHEVAVRGYRIRTATGELLEHSESAPVADGLFFFRLQGHPDRFRLGVLGEATFPEVLLCPGRADYPPLRYCYGPSVAVATRDGDTVVGQVPQLMSPDLDALPGMVGRVTKTFIEDGWVVGGEVLLATPGYVVKLSHRGVPELDHNADR